MQLWLSLCPITLNLHQITIFYLKISLYHLLPVGGQSEGRGRTCALESKMISKNQHLQPIHLTGEHLWVKKRRKARLTVHLRRLDWVQARRPELQPSAACPLPVPHISALMEILYQPNVVARTQCHLEKHF